MWIRRLGDIKIEKMMKIIRECKSKMRKIVEKKNIEFNLKYNWKIGKFHKKWKFF